MSIFGGSKGGPQAFINRINAARARNQRLSPSQRRASQAALDRMPATESLDGDSDADGATILGSRKRVRRKVLSGTPQNSQNLGTATLLGGG